MVARRVCEPSIPLGIAGPGDKIMQVENDYDRDVYSGDLGVVSCIDMEECELVANFDGREVAYGFGELDELVLAYATIIDKSKGSEYRKVSAYYLAAALTNSVRCAHVKLGKLQKLPQ
jgi:hypothetical protein